jgi:DNA-binding response OmpR family regulator
MAPCVHSMGYDPHLMIGRTLILRRAGYVVEEVYERTAALSQAQSDTVDVLLICHTVPKVETQWLIANIRENRKLIPILCLTLSIHEVPDDVCIGVENDPEELLNALRRTIELSRFRDAS